MNTYWSNKVILFGVLFTFTCFIESSNASANTHHPPALHVERLARHVLFLQKINTTLKNPTIQVNSIPDICKHALMQWCIQKIHDERCINVVFDVWKTFSTHSTNTCLNDCLFVHNFAALIYVIYMNMITLATRTPLQDFIILYEQVSELPIEELLNLLDILYERMEIIFQVYSATPLTPLSIAAKKYWWVPIAILAALSVKFMHWHIQHTAR